MSSQELIKELVGLKIKISNFKTITKKYKSSHNYYKKGLRNLKLGIRKFLLKYNKDNETSLIEINKVFSDFINSQNCSSNEYDNLIDKLEMKIQELEINSEKDVGFLSERIYDKNSPFRFHTDIKEIIDTAQKEIFIVEPFVNEHILEITFKDLDRSLKINILTNSNNADKRGKFTKLSDLFKKDFSKYEVRETEEIHDRGLFVDNKDGWVMGQSIKDAAKSKPTYLIKLKNPKALELIYRQIWNCSKNIH